MERAQGKNVKVIGFGDNVIDRYVNKNIMFPGGNAVNFAAYARMNQAEAAYLGLFGEDAEAEHIQYALRELGVTMDYCEIQTGSTTQHCDVCLENGDRIFGNDDKRPTNHGPKVLAEKDLEYLSEFLLIHSGCYASEETEIVKLRGLESFVTFDFSCEKEFRSEEYLSRICPCIDLALFSAEHMTEKQVEELQKQVYSMGTPYILVTNGTKGQTLYDGKEFYEGKVKPVKPKDTMGAGDSFFTAFVISLLRQGWKRGERLNREQIDHAFTYAADFSAKICLVDGSFGFGIPITRK